ncbi:MAG: PLDc N-terminal domain-containing protein [Rhodobacteraceae bacterium]|nr:PLDc N-terminal domain-containing protein [Paracoccaceae bacterium]
MIWFDTHLLVVAFGLMVAATAVVILQQRRSPQATLAWLMFLVLVPYLAIPAFFAIGFRKRPRRSPERPKPSAIPDGEMTGHPEIESMLCRYGLEAATGGNQFNLLVSGESAWADLVELIESAETSLDVTLYILGNDPVGRRFCQALEAKARQGVSVRVILDGIGSFKRPRMALRRLGAAGGKVCLHSPFIHSPFGGRLNLRNHRKMVIADGARVWAGGRNVARQYLGPAPTAGRWHDLSFRIAGPAVARYVSVFQSDWKAINGSQADMAVSVPQSVGDSVLQTIPAGPDQPDDPLHDALVFACHSAKRRVWVSTPYFLPTPALSEALSIAVRRGVDVRLLTPAKSDQMLTDLARGSWLREVQHNGCHIHFYPEMIHAKAILADQLIFVGSANLDARSLLLNFEMMVLLYSAADMAEVERWIEGMLAKAPVGILPAGPVRRSIEGVFKLVSPML